MRLVSLNVWGGTLFEPLMEYVRLSEADIYCFQEVTFRREPAPAQLYFYWHGKRLIQQTDVFTPIRAALDGFVGQFCPALFEELSDEGGETYLAQFGLASFVDARMPVVEQVQRFVFRQFDPRSRGEPPVARNFHALRLLDPKSSRTFIVGHVHGLHDPRGKLDTPERRGQAERIVAALEDLRVGDEPIVLCGDFNLLPGSWTFGLLQERLGLQDLVTANGFTDTRTSHYTKPERYADYLLVTDNVFVERFEVVAEPEVSDHRPLLLEFSLQD